MNKPAAATFVGLSKGAHDRRLALHHGIIKVTAYSVASVLAVLLLTAALPPLVATQSDRAILDSRVTLLTTPISGEVSSLRTTVGERTGSGGLVAVVQNTRVDETALITLSSKVAELTEKVANATNKRQSDQRYVEALDSELSAEKAALLTQIKEKVSALQSKVASAEADVDTKSALNDRQKQLLARNVVSRDMLKPGTHELASVVSMRDSAGAALAGANAQFAAVKHDLFVGDDLIGVATLAQKRRDVAFDEQREAIEQNAAQTALEASKRLLKQELARVDSMKRASLTAPPRREVLQVGVAEGRHVNAGDAVATLVDCSSLFAVAIFSYREAADLAVGTRMQISGQGLPATIDGTVQDIIPKSSDKTDELYAVPFPQTERREMYVVVHPDNDQALRTRGRSGDVEGSCPVGKWVTVSRADGWVPSTSVLWQKATGLLHTAAAAFGPSGAQAQPHAASHE